MITNNNTAGMRPDIDINSYQADALLRYLIDNNIINMDDIVNDMNRKRKEQLLQQHKYSIFKGNDGRWKTHIIDSNGNRKLIAKATQAELEEYLCSFYMESGDDKSAKITLSSLFPEWIEYKALKVSSGTIRRTKTDWNKYYKGTAFADIPLKEIKKINLDKWVHEMIKEHGMNNHQYTGFHAILKQLLDYAVDYGYISKNPADDLKVEKKRVLVREHKKEDQSQVFSKREFEQLQSVAWSDFNNKKYPVHQLTPLAVMFMFYTGLRIGEVCAVRYEDIDDNDLIIRRMYSISDKRVIERTKGTFGDRRVPIIPQAMELIKCAAARQQEEEVSTDGYIFSMNDYPISYSSVSKAFYSYCKKIGTSPKSSHKARKTFVSTLIDSDVNINTIRQIVGHQDERTTLNNYCYDRSSENEKYNKISNAFS